MKKQILFKSALSLVAAAAAGSVFAALPYNEDFESPWQEGDLITTDSQWAAGEGDASAIALGNGGQVLELKTEGATLTNTLASADASDANTAIAEGDKAVFEAEVKFVPSDNQDCGLTGGEDDTKFALFAYAPDGGPTNLVVFHGYTDPTSSLPAYTNEVIDVNGALDNDAFVKVTVKMFSADENLYFTVDLGEGAQKQSLQTQVADAFHDPSLEDAAHPLTWFMTVNGAASGLDQVSKICFKGTGMVDNLGVSTESATPTTITVALNWPSGITPVEYTVNGVTNSLAGQSAPYSITDVPSDAAVSFVIANADGATKTLTLGAGETSIDATGATFGWPDYLGAAVSGAYQIDDANDLDMLRKGVAAGLTTSGETFKQTADIDMASAGAFAGIGAYEKVPTAGTPFLGTYDGQGYTIANVTRAGGNTQGIFNQVGPSGVVENLVVSNMVFDSAVTGEYGFAIVGNAGGGATLRNLTAAGTFASASKPSTHNIAGIAVRLSPGATAGAATTIDSCTNNATIYGGYTKLGGINAIVQNQTGFADGKVVFVNCANNGALVCKRTATDVTGNAGIVGYFSGTNVELTGCYGNGVITNEDGANTDKDGALVGWTNGGTIKDNGGNSAPANKKMIGTWGSATETGFLYATVDNGVATTISGEIAAGGNYLLEGNAAPSVSLAYGDTVTFDKSLGYTLDETGITTSATGCEVVGSGTTTRTFTVAYVTVNVTVTGGANATAAWTVAGESVGSAPSTLTYGQTWAVTLTADSNYEFDGNATTNLTGTAGAVDFTIALPDATQQSSGSADWVPDPTSVTNQTAASVYSDLTGTKLANADAGELTKWADDNNVEFSTAVSNADSDTYVEAFLLNCAPNAAAVAAEKDAFVLNITFENGVPVVTTPEGKTYHGLQMKGSNDLSTWTDVEEASSSYQFYKCELSL